MCAPLHTAYTLYAHIFSLDAYTGILLLLGAVMLELTYSKSNRSFKVSETFKDWF